MRELHHAVRRLRASPMFTVAATLTLAIAVGATTSVFAVVDGVLLKAFPYRSPDRVLAIWESNPSVREPQFFVAPGTFLAWRAQSHAFSTLAAVRDRQFTVAGKRDAQQMTGASVTPSYFAVLGLSPVIGRALAQDSSGPAEVVIGDGYWRRQFGGRSSVLGQTLDLDDTLYTIVGVMPPGLPGETELWTRLSFNASQAATRDSHYLTVYGRLAPDASPEGGLTDLETIAARLAVMYPRTNDGWSVVANPLVDQLVGKVRPALIMLLAAAACVLLIGVANLANLFLVRSLARQRELALRTALGATRRRLVHELLAEAVLLGLAAGLMGVAGALGGVRILRSLAPPTLPRVAQIGIDVRVVSFCALTCIVSVLIFGMLPAWQASRGKVAEMLKEGGRGTGSAQSRGLQDSLVVLQVAVALMLLTGAGLLVESFARFARMDPGFRPEGVLTAQVALPAQRYPTPERQAAFVTSVIERLEAQRGVEAAAAGDALPDTPNPNKNAFAIIGDPTPEATHVPLAYAIGITPGYFHTMGIRVTRGRDVLPTDRTATPKVAIVDQLLARRYFAGRDPIGQRFVLRDTPTGPDTIRIVGVVATVKEGGLAATDFPEIYAPMSQYQEPTASLVLRAAADPEALTPTVRQVVASIDPTVPVSDIRTMSSWMAESIGTTRFSAFLASLFAAIAAILGAVGIYSVLAYIVTQRRREIAVRLALGAHRTRVMSDVLRHALALTAIGIAIGSSATWMLTRVLSALFIGVSPHDPVIFAAAAALFTVVALVAAAVPALRTTRVNPVVALTST